MSKRRKNIVLLFVIFSALFVWCSLSAWLWKRTVLVESTRMLMDTAVTVKLYVNDRQYGENLLEEAFAEGDRIERIMEPVKGDGEVQRLNTRNYDSWHVLSADLKFLLDQIQLYYHYSDGAFDPTVARVKWLWTFEDGASIPDENEINQKLTSVGFSHIEISGDSIRFALPETQIDLGGVAKGYAVDRMMSILKLGDTVSGLVNAGGDIATFGEKPGGKDWVIGLRHPRLNRTIILDPTGFPAVATSGDYERYFIADGIRYHHILDPSTGYPSHKSISVTVWTSNAMIADILSTSLFVLGPEKGIELAERLDNVEALIFYEDDGKVEASLSSGLQGRINL